MKRRISSGLLMVIAIAGALAFALDRYLAMSEAQQMLESRIETISEVQRLAARQSAIFSKAVPLGEPTSLKALVQDVTARHGLTVTYLNENERDIGDKIRERTVLTRSVNVSHEKLISALAELESRAGGARMKEIRVKLSKDQCNVYEEVETVLALRSIAPAPPAKGGIH